MADPVLRPATGRTAGLLAADIIIIANAPDSVFVADLEGNIPQANDAVSHLLGFRQDEVIEQHGTEVIAASSAHDALEALVAHRTAHFPTCWLATLVCPAKTALT